LKDIWRKSGEHGFKSSDLYLTATGIAENSDFDGHVDDFEVLKVKFREYCEPYYAHISSDFSRMCKTPQQKGKPRRFEKKVHEIEQQEDAELFIGAIEIERSKQTAIANG